MKGKEKTLKRVKEVADYNLANQDLRHQRSPKGITLVALVVTIIVLLILAGVTIATLFGENGLITMAQKAKSETENAQANAMAEIGSLINEMNSILNGGGTEGGTPVEPDDPTSPDEQVGPNGNPLLSTVTDTNHETDQYEDTKGNIVTVPKGFKIAADSGSTVQDGIVIEDSEQNQFVWIPVGVVTKTDGTKSNEIKLGRYTFKRVQNETTGVYEDGTPILENGKYQYAYTKNADGTYTDNYQNEVTINSYYKELSTYREGNDTTENATAKKLKEFVDSVKANGGYYIARYEASYGSGSSLTDWKPLSKKSTAFRTEEDGSMNYVKGTLWNYAKQKEASKVCQNMYSETDNNIGVKSDLVNSYAWDTAIVYIQEMGNNNFANLTSNDVGSTGLANTGNNGEDKFCNIYDMAGNVGEWTTEYSLLKLLGTARPCVTRGGNCNNSDSYTAVRYYYRATSGGDLATGYFGYVGFRPLLYVK